MTCAEMYEQMLEADLTDLRLDAASPLAAHLRDCTRCASIATRVTRDTSLLATAVARRRSRRPSTLPRYAAVAVAATLCITLARFWPASQQVQELTVLQGALVSAADTTSVRPPADARSTSPGATARTMSAPAPIAAHPAVGATEVRPRRFAVAAAERPRAIAALRLQGTREATLGTAVSADPAGGKRATIIRTANPAITVVWLQD